MPPRPKTTTLAPGSTLAVLMTEAPRQPVEVEGKIFHVPVGPRVCVQGAPTSPGLCNAILARLDRRLAGLAACHEFQYTRYADDLTFSGDDVDKVKLLLNIATRIVDEEGFAVNARKTRVQRRARRQCVTGVVVNQHAGLSRKERRRLRARIHQFNGDAEERPRLEVCYYVGPPPTATPTPTPTWRGQTVSTRRRSRRQRASAM